MRRREIERERKDEARTRREVRLHRREIESMHAQPLITYTNGQKENFTGWCRTFVQWREPLRLVWKVVEGRSSERGGIACRTGRRTLIRTEVLRFEPSRAAVEFGK